MGNKHTTLEGRKFSSLPSQDFPTTNNIPENLSIVRSGSSGKLFFPFYKLGSKRKWKQSNDKINSNGKKQSNVPFLDSLFMPEFVATTDISADDFPPLNLIAKGAYGNVLRVRAKPDNKIYAMKILDKSQIVVENAVQQSKDEVTIQDNLGHHPFIVSCHYYWQSKKNLYIVMDYIPNGELLDWWMEVGSFPEGLARIYIAEVAMVLDFLNSRGVIYRDLKMENLLLNSDYHLKVIDFGLAKWVRLGNRTRTICGTLHYMAPEVLSVTPYGHAADWWTLGILMYTLIAGEFPVSRSTHHVEMAKKVAACDFTLPNRHSIEAQSLVKKLLERDPAKRLQNLDVLKAQPFFRHLDFEKLLRKEINPLDFLPSDAPLPGTKMRQQEEEAEEIDVFPEEDFPKVPTSAPPKLVSFEVGDEEQESKPDAMKYKRKQPLSAARKKLFSEEIPRNLEEEQQKLSVEMTNQIQTPTKIKNDDAFEAVPESEPDNKHSLNQLDVLVQSSPVDNVALNKLNSPISPMQSEKMIESSRLISAKSVITARKKPTSVDLSPEREQTVKEEYFTPSVPPNQFVKKNRRSLKRVDGYETNVDEAIDSFTPDLLRQASEKLMASRGVQSNSNISTNQRPQTLDLNIEATDRHPSSYLESDLDKESYKNQTSANEISNYNRYRVKDRNYSGPPAPKVENKHQQYVDTRKEYRASIVDYYEDYYDRAKRLSKSAPTTPKTKRHVMNFDELEAFVSEGYDVIDYGVIDDSMINIESYQTKPNKKPSNIAGDKTHGDIHNSPAINRNTFNFGKMPTSPKSPNVRSPGLPVTPSTPKSRRELKEIVARQDNSGSTIGAYSPISRSPGIVMSEKSTPQALIVEIIKPLIMESESKNALTVEIKNDSGSGKSTPRRFSPHRSHSPVTPSPMRSRSHTPSGVSQSSPHTIEIQTTPTSSQPSPKYIGMSSSSKSESSPAVSMNLVQPPRSKLVLNSSEERQSERQLELDKKPNDELSQYFKFPDKGRREGKQSRIPASKLQQSDLNQTNKNLQSHNGMQTENSHIQYMQHKIVSPNNKKDTSGLGPNKDITFKSPRSADYNRPRGRTSWQIMMNEIENNKFTEEGENDFDAKTIISPGQKYPEIQVSSPFRHEISDVLSPDRKENWNSLSPKTAIVYNGSKSAPVTPVHKAKPNVPPRSLIVAQNVNEDLKNSVSLSDENLRQRQFVQMNTPRVRESWQKVIDEGLYFPQTKKFQANGKSGIQSAPVTPVKHVPHISPLKGSNKLPVESPNTKMQSVKDWYKRIMVSSGMSPKNMTVRHMSYEEQNSVIQDIKKLNEGSNGENLDESRTAYEASYRHAIEEGLLSPDELPYDQQLRKTAMRYGQISPKRSIAPPQRRMISPQRGTMSPQRQTQNGVVENLNRKLTLSEIVEVNDEVDEEESVKWRNSKLVSGEMNF